MHTEPGVTRDLGRVYIPNFGSMAVALSCMKEQCTEKGDQGGKTAGNDHG